MTSLILIILLLYILSCLFPYKALEDMMTSQGMRCLQRDFPVVCLGGGADMEVTLTHGPHRTLATKVCRVCVV